ncbi:hypothetical protein TgHK011_007869 [Trichoderma gracile]|nr:hypothetical protein TgHK011_007869 [Trichoderma gracile]
MIRQPPKISLLPNNLPDLTRKYIPLPSLKVDTTYRCKAHGTAPNGSSLPLHASSRPLSAIHPTSRVGAGRRTNCPVLIPAERPLLPLELWPLRGALLVAVAVIVLGQSPLRLRDPEAGLGQAPVPGRNQKGLLG